MLVNKSVMFSSCLRQIFRLRIAKNQNDDAELTSPVELRENEEIMVVKMLLLERNFVETKLGGLVQFS